MRILLSKITTVALLLVIVWLGRGVLVVAAQKAGVTKALHDVQARVQGLEQQRTDLQEGIARLANPSYLEREAREKLNLKGADERVAYILQAPVPERLASSSATPSDSELEKAKQWLYNLVGKLQLGSRD